MTLIAEDGAAAVEMEHRLTPRDGFPWPYALLLTLLSVIGIALVLPFATEIMSAPDGPLAERPEPPPLILWLVLMALVSLAVVGVGLRAALPLGLGWPPLHDGSGTSAPPARLVRVLVHAAALGISAGLLLAALPLLFTLPEFESFNIPSWQSSLLASIGAGIREEIWLRLGMMSVVAWVLAKLSASASPPAAVFWGANVASALLFGATHLPQTAAFAPLTAPLVIFVFLANGTVGVVCGWLYWRRGIVAAMVSHASADIVLKVVLPLLGVGLR